MKMVSKDETYSLFALRFRVYPLWQYALEYLKPQRIKIDQIAKYYGFIKKKNTISMFSLNRRYAMKLKPKDYRQPILIVQLGKESNLMIDGIHRTYRAWKKGQKTIRAYHITDQDILKEHSNMSEFNLK